MYIFDSLKVNLSLETMKYISKNTSLYYENVIL